MQDPVINIMQLLGYQSDNEGICYGLAYMFLKAASIDDLATFDLRLKMIHSIDVYFKSYPDIQKEIQNSNDTVFQKLNKILELLTNEKITIENYQIFKEIPAFCEGVELYQQPELYSEFFGSMSPKTQQRSELVMPLLLSKNFETKKNGIVSTPPIFSGSYKQKDLENYFQSLGIAIEKTNFTEPIALVLESSNHAISVSYDNKTKHWVFFNANKLETKYNLDALEMAKKVLSAFSKNNITVFSTKLYTTELQQNKLHQLEKNWQKQKAWKEIHKISAKKIKMIDSDGACWLFVAAMMGIHEEVKKLLQIEGVNPNLKRNNASPLYIASYEGHLLVVKLLLLHKDINLIFQSEDKYSPINAAKKNNHDEIVIILKRAVDIRQILEEEKEQNGTSLRYKALQRYYNESLFANKEEATQIEKNFMIVESCHSLQKTYQGNNKLKERALILIEEYVQIAYQQYINKINFNEILSDLETGINKVLENYKNKSFKKVTLTLFEFTNTENELKNLIDEIFPTKKRNHGFELLSNKKIKN